MKIDIYWVNGQPCIPLDQVAHLIKEANPPHNNAFIQQAIAKQARAEVPVGYSGQQIAQGGFPNPGQIR
jgi:hypothetical protein